MLKRTLRGEASWGATLTAWSLTPTDLTLAGTSSRHCKHFPAQIRQEFDRLKSKYETYTESVSNFEPLKARHESKKEAVITAAAAPYLGGENESWSWWQRAREKVIEFLRAEGVIAKFLREISISMKKVSMM